jgi:hypothetical protein
MTLFGTKNQEKEAPYKLLKVHRQKLLRLPSLLKMFAGVLCRWFYEPSKGCYIFCEQSRTAL